MRVSDQQKRVMAFFKAYEDERGEPPLLREAAAFLGLSRQRVWQIVKALERKGLMARFGGDSRAWRVTLPGKEDRNG